MSGALVFTSSDLGFAAATQGMTRVAGFSGSYGTNNQRQILADYHHQGIAQRGDQNTHLSLSVKKAYLLALKFWPERHALSLTPVVGAHEQTCCLGSGAPLSLYSPSVSHGSPLSPRQKIYE